MILKGAVDCRVDEFDVRDLAKRPRRIIRPQGCINMPVSDAVTKAIIAEARGANETKIEIFIDKVVREDH